MVCSPARLAANRANAQRSTGPKTPEGKDRSKRNALKHGLTGAGAVVANQLATAVATRILEWQELFQPADAFEVWVVEQLVLATVRLDRCVAIEQERRRVTADRAAICWEEDQRLAAAELGERLAHRPAAVSCQLRQTPAGCTWLIEHWEGLARVLDQSGTWNDAQRGLAQDLRGVPTELRDVDPWLAPGTDQALVDRVRREIANLIAHRDDVLTDLDDAQRARTASGAAFDVSPEAWRLRRYEAYCNRTMHWALNRLQRRRREPPRPADNDSDPSEFHSNGHPQVHDFAPASAGGPSLSQPSTHYPRPTSNPVRFPEVPSDLLFGDAPDSWPAESDPSTVGIPVGNRRQRRAWRRLERQARACPSG